MKSVSDYFIGKPLDVKYDNGYNVVINRDELLNILRQIQIDTIRETCQACADNADADYTIIDNFDPVTGEDIEIYVIKSSILEIADKLIKELE
jgi:hypothetical protein